MNKEKLYFKIENVRLNNHLFNYLKKICKDENVQIVEEYVDSYSWINNKETTHSKFNAEPTRDVLLWSYSKEKLLYINYIYSDYKKRFEASGKFVSNVIINKEKECGVLQDKNGSIWSNNCTTNYVDFLENNYGIRWYAPTNVDALIPTFTKNEQSTVVNKKSNLEIFKEKVVDIFEDWKFEILYFCFGAMFSTITVIIMVIILLTIKHFMIG